jgi:hypothetical protein
MRNPWERPHIKAETAEECEQILTEHGLRQRIFEASRYDPLVRQVMDLAMVEGLNTEEMFARLAYSALVAKDDAWAALLENLHTSVPPSIVVNVDQLSPEMKAKLKNEPRLDRVVDSIALGVVQSAAFSNRPIEVDSSQYRALVSALRSAYHEGINDGTQHEIMERDQV